MNLRRSLGPGLRTSTKVAADLADRVKRPPEGITILIYHRVTESGSSQMELATGTFDAQLTWLADTQRVITLDAAVAELAAADEIEPGVVITFDDGTNDWVDNVLPALDRHRLPATFYLATSFVEDGADLPGGARPISWAGVRELASHPLMTVGSHTHRHMLLDRLDPARLDDELDRSIELLGDRADVEAQHFAYPKSVAGSPQAEEAVRLRFRSAVLAGTRANSAGADLHRLNRSPVQRSDDERWFRRKVTGGMRLEDDIRVRLNQLRYRALSS